MLDENYIPDEVLTDIMNNRLLTDEAQVREFTPEEALYYFMEWNCLGGYAHLVREAVDGLFIANALARLKAAVAEEPSENVYDNVTALLAEVGHRGDSTLKLVYGYLQQYSKSQRPLALIKIKEMLG